MRPTRFVGVVVLLLGGLLGSGLLVSSLPGCSPQGRPLGRPSAEALVLWSGAVTPTTARVHARVPPPPNMNTAPAERFRLRLHPTEAPDRVRVVQGTPADGVPDMLHFALSGLTPETAYTYVLTDTNHAAHGGTGDDVARGHFRTFAAGPQSFRVAVGSCAQTGSRHPVFDAIRATAPDLLLHIGDMHYEDIASPHPAAFQAAYHRVHASPEQSALFRSAPIAYVWDDHDYGPNNSSRRAPGQDAAQQVYRAYVPHYARSATDAATDAATPIYQAFTIGRVRFLLTDVRSARTPNDAVARAPRTMMGLAQKAWFKAELAAARDRFPLVVWVSSVPWIANDPDALDAWSGFPEERRELASFIDSLGMADQLAMVSGDAHMVALDDGTHNRYGTREGMGFPVVHAAALDRPGSTKGGPYTHGPFPNRSALFGGNDGQFVLMDVSDAGDDALCVTWTGMRHRYDRRDVVPLFSWRTCFAAPG